MPGVRCISVPIRLVFHERDAFPFGGVGDDDRRPVVDFTCQLHGLRHLPDRMPVYFDDMPAAGFPFAGQRFKRHDFMDGPIQLHIVIVQDGGQTGQLIFCRRHRPLPHNARLALAIPQQDKSAIRLFIQAGSQRQAGPDCHTVSKQSAGHVHAGRLQPVRVALVAAIQLTPIIQLGEGKEAAPGQGRIEQRRGMPLAQDEAVAQLPIRPGRVDIQPVEIQHGHDFRRRERPARMPRPAPMDQPQAIHAQLAGKLFQLGYLFRSQRPHTTSFVFCILFSIFYSPISCRNFCTSSHQLPTFQRPYTPIPPRGSGP